MKKQRTEDLSSLQDSKALLEQIKALREELLKNKEQYEEQITGLEQEKKALEQKATQAATEKAKLDQGGNEEKEKLRAELTQQKEALAKCEAQLRNYEVNYSRKTEGAGDSSQLKELLSKVKEDNARLKEELSTKTADSKETEDRLGELKVASVLTRK